MWTSDGDGYEYVYGMRRRRAGSKTGVRGKCSGDHACSPGAGRVGLQGAVRVLQAGVQVEFRARQLAGDGMALRRERVAADGDAVGVTRFEEIRRQGRAGDGQESDTRNGDLHFFFSESGFIPPVRYIWLCSVVSWRRQKEVRMSRIRRQS